MFQLLAEVRSRLRFSPGLIFHYIPSGLQGFVPTVFCTGQHMARKHTDAHADMHTHSGLQSPVKTKLGSASVNAGHCYGHYFPPRIFAPRGASAVRLWRRSCSSLSYIKNPEESFALHLCDHVIIMQAVECDLCAPSRSLALLFPSFAGFCFNCLAP